MAKKEADKNKVGAPTKYSQELADKVCELIANSSHGLRKICEDNDISYTSIKRWLRDNAEFCTQYEKAKQEQCDFLADEIIAIADNRDGDLLSTEFGQTGNSTNVQRARLQIDARKWVASKLKPKKYGDRLDVTTDGEKINKMSVEDVVSIMAEAEKKLEENK